MDKKDGNSEMSIYTCSVKKQHQSCWKLHFKRGFVKMHENLPQSNHLLLSSFIRSMKAGQKLETELEQQVQTGDRSSTLFFSALMLTDLDELDKLNYVKL